MKLYRIDVRIVGTAYVEAKSARAARAKLREYVGSELPDVNGEPFTDASVPTVSLSPAMMLDGLYPGAEELEEEV